MPTNISYGSMYSGHLHPSMDIPYNPKIHNNKLRVDCSGREESLIDQVNRCNVKLETLNQRFVNQGFSVYAPSATGCFHPTDGSNGTELGSLFNLQDQLDACDRAEKAYKEAQKSLQEYGEEDHVGDHVSFLSTWI
jgi:hypothetical protein